MEVFLEPVALDRPNDPSLAFYQKARAHAETGGRAAVITRLDEPGHGKKLLLRDDGQRDGTLRATGAPDPSGAARVVEGSLGEAFLDERFTSEAQEALAAGKSRTLFLEGVRAFVEVFAPPAILALVGASHVAMPLVSFARTLGFRTIVIDGRPRFA